jgi:hypothetical protein
MWGVDPESRPGRDGVIDLTPADDPSSQVTAPIDPIARERATPADSWSARDRTSGQARGAGATVSYPPPATSATPRARKSRGPGGCVLGLLAFLIIAAVGGLFAWGVAKPMVSDRVRDELDHGLATQVAAIDAPSLQLAGTQRLTEDQINQELRRFDGSFDPVNNVQVRITPDDLRVTFDLYGVTSTYRGGVAVENGRIVVVDPELSGPAAQFLSAQDVAGILEVQFASLMERSNAQPTAVRLRDGEITVTTKQV